MPTPLDRIIPLYRKRVLQRAKENEAALRASGAYSPAEFERFKSDLVDAYRSPRPLDTRRELEPRPERFEGWMRRLRR